MTVSREFYAVTAQIIPVILILLVVQSQNVLTRRVTDKQKPSDVLVGITMTITSLLAAQAASLAGLLGLKWNLLPLIIILGIGISTQQIVSAYLIPKRKLLVIEMRNDATYWHNKGTRTMGYISITLSYFPQYLVYLAVLIYIFIWTRNYH